MKLPVKKTLLRLLRARQRARWNAPDIAREPLTSAEKMQVDAIWGRIWSKPNYRWHEHFKRVNEEFDPRYLPVDTFFLDLLPRLSNLPLVRAWEDKSYCCSRFPETPFPAMAAACIDGTLYDKDLVPCDYERVWSAVEKLEVVFVKPSIGSCQGLGAYKLNASEVGGADELARILSDSGENYVIQELITQHEVLASLNSSSVNIIRMNTVRLGEGDPFSANATIRFGIPGYATDVAYVDGVETVRVLGLTEEGVVRGSFFDQDGNKVPLSELSPSLGGTVLPGFDRAQEVCLAMHRRLHHFGMVGFDVAITDKAEPVVIEMNLNGPGVRFYQYANGPFFGERTEEVIEWCRNRTPRERPWELS